jgi:predicted Zn finger-like uncharacterized protein
MPIIVACPACGGKLRVADDLLGRRVRCPACQATFDAGRPPAPGATGPLNLSLDDGPTAPAPPSAGTPGLVGAVELKSSAEAGPDAPPEAAPPPRPEGRRGYLRECPACSRQVHPDSRRCYHCGTRFDIPDDGGRERNGLPRLTLDGPVRRDCEPHRGPLVLTFGVLSLVMLSICFPIGAVLGVVAWAWGQGDLRKLRRGDMDPAGQGLTQAGWICGIIGTALNGLFTLGCAGLFGLAWFDSRPRPRPTPPPAWQKQQPKWVNPPDDGP